MALPKFEKDISVISKLSDQPNDTAGSALSAADLKAKFDEAGNELKAFLNENFIPFLEGTEAAASIGISTISGMSEVRTIQEALEALKYAIDNTATGAIPDSSLSGEKLEPDSITDRELAPGAVQFSNMAPNAVSGDVVSDKGIGGSKLEDGCLENRHLGKLIVEDANIADKTIDAAGKIKDGTLTAKLFAPKSVQETAIDKDAVTGSKIAKGAVSESVVLTLAAAAWAGGSQTVTVAIVSEDNTVFVSPAPEAENYAAYTEAAVRCTAQGSGTLTFTCNAAPAADISVNVTVINK